MGELGSAALGLAVAWGYPEQVPSPRLLPWQQARQQLCQLFLALVPLHSIFRVECELLVRTAAELSLGGQGPPAAALLSKAELRGPGAPLLWGAAVPSSTPLASSP